MPLIGTVDVRDPAFFLESTVIPIGSSFLYISSTESVAADAGPLGIVLVLKSVDFVGVGFGVAEAPFTLLSTADGAFNPPILLAVGFAVVGRDKPLVPKDVPGRVLFGAFSIDGAGVLGAAAPVAVGLFNPPPMEDLGASLGTAGDDLIPLDEFMPDLADSPGFVNGVVAFKPNLDGVVFLIIALFGTGVETVLLVVDVVEAVVGLIPIDVFDVTPLALLAGAFYNVSTKVFNLVISSLTLTIFVFISSSTFDLTVESIIFNIDSLRFSGSSAMALSRFYLSMAA